MIDLHCHILPGIDDGPASMDESLAMCRLAAQDGIHTIVATPHTLNGQYENPTSEVIEHVSALNKALIEYDIRVRILPGSEVHLSRDLWGSVESGEAGTINNDKKYLLLELPIHAVPPRLKDEIFGLKVRGITPIIAHPERNMVIQRDSSILYDCIQSGALSQITAASRTGGFGGLVMHCSETLLEHRLVHIIASDAHSYDSRPPILSQGVEAASQILGNWDEAERMVVGAPETILSGQGFVTDGILKA